MPSLIGPIAFDSQKYLGTKAEERVAEGALYKQFFKGEEEKKREAVVSHEGRRGWGGGAWCGAPQ